MKRLIYTLLLAVSVTSCSNDEVMDTAGYRAISFGNVFVDNATRAAGPYAEGDLTDVTGTSLRKFYVYANLKGNTDNEVNIYKEAEVYREDQQSDWVCDEVQYWIPQSTYTFHAVAPVSDKVKVTATNGLPTVIHYPVSCQQDLIHATVTAMTDLSGTPTTGVNDENKVAFTFNHLLTKVQFTFTNKFTEESGVTLTVKDIRITNAASSADYDMTSWKNHGQSDATVDFGQTENFAPGKTGTGSKRCVLIPHKQKFLISFTVSHNKGGKDTPMTAETEEITLEKGHCYNFTAELDQNNVTGVVPIVFDITYNEDWVEENPNDVQYP